jgi:hypothetical protein
MEEQSVELDAVMRRVQKLLAIAQDNEVRALRFPVLFSPNESEALLEHKAGNALVVAKKDALEEAFGKFKYGESKAYEPHNERAFVEGIRKAREVDLNRRGLGNDQPGAGPLLLG